MAKHKQRPKQKMPPKIALTAAVGLRFRKGKFRGIDLDAAFPVVAKKKEAFFGHKAILFEGICAWVKRSRTNAAARKAVAKTTARHIAVAETKVAETMAALFNRRAGKSPDAPLGGKKRVAAAALGYAGAFSDDNYRPLYVQVYLQIGGMSAVTDAYKLPAKHHTTKTKTKRARPKGDAAIRYLVAVAAILDYHARELSPKPEMYGKPSISKAAPLGGLLTKSGDHSPAEGQKMGRLGNTQVNEFLAEHKRAFALLYGADRVQVTENLSLLDHLLQKKPVSSEIAPHIVEWLQYTKYFSDSVLADMKGGWEKTYSPSIGRIKARQPELPALSEEQIREIQNAFRVIERASEARLQFKNN